MHELCIAWSLTVRAGTPWRFKVVVSRPVYFSRSFSRSVNFLARPGINYSVREVEVTFFVANCMWKLAFRGTCISRTFLYLTNRGILNGGVLLCRPARHRKLMWLYVQMYCLLPVLYISVLSKQLYTILWYYYISPLSYSGILFV